MKHLNDNLMCAIAIRTTGVLPRHHDLVEISIIPIDWSLEIHDKKSFYTMYIMPNRLENLDWEALKQFKLPDNNLDYRPISITKKDLRTYVERGTDENLAADMLVKWCEQNIPLFPRKRIMPLAFDWGFCRPFIEDWLGPATFDLCFDQRVRDIHAAALFMNDRAGYKDLNHYPFAKTNLAYIINRMKAGSNAGSETLSDAVNMITAYRHMCKEIL